MYTEGGDASVGGRLPAARIERISRAHLGRRRAKRRRKEGKEEREKMTRHFNRASFHLSSLFIGNFRSSRPSPGVIDRHCLGDPRPSRPRTLFIPPATPSRRPIVPWKLSLMARWNRPLHATIFRDNSFLREEVNFCEVFIGEVLGKWKIGKIFSSVHAFIKVIVNRSQFNFSK